VEKQELTAWGQRTGKTYLEVRQTSTPRALTLKPACRSSVNRHMPGICRDPRHPTQPVRPSSTSNNRHKLQFSRDDNSILDLTSCQSLLDLNLCFTCSQAQSVRGCDCSVGFRCSHEHADYQPGGQAHLQLCVSATHHAETVRRTNVRHACICISST
jgi:hypothetical protein